MRPRPRAALLAATAALALAPLSGVAGAAASDGGMPPWDRLPDTTDRAAAAGLTVAPMAGTGQHIHAHLDVLVDGRGVAVPGGVGIDPTGTQFAEIHTHEDSGILHIESADAAKQFTLSQFFAEWGVRLDEGHLGGLPSDARHQVRVYVGGTPVEGDPGAVHLANHEEIAVVYGDPDARTYVPTRYGFPPDL